MPPRLLWSCCLRPVSLFVENAFPSTSAATVLNLEADMAQITISGAEVELPQGSSQEVPTWCISNFDCWAKSATFALRFSGKLVYVYAREVDLVGWTAQARFNSLTETAMEDSYAEEELSELVENSLREIVKQEATVSADCTNHSVQQYYSPETLYYRLVATDGRLQSVLSAEDRTMDHPHMICEISLDKAALVVDIPSVDAASAPHPPNGRIRRYRCSRQHAPEGETSQREPSAPSQDRHNRKVVPAGVGNLDQGGADPIVAVFEATATLRPGTLRG